MAQRFYPAVIMKDPETDFGVAFPDFPGCFTTGEDVQQAAINATEVLGLHVDSMFDMGAVLPPPSAPDAALPDWLEGAVPVACVLIPVNIPGHAVRANITIDDALLTRLDAAAKADGMSRSGFIAEAVRERLRRQGRDKA